MNLKMGSQSFYNVEIPILWGTRAILQDQEGRFSVINLGGREPKIEILGNKPGPNIPYEIVEDGYKIISDDQEAYIFSPDSGRFTGVSLRLPECQIQGDQTKIGNSIISGSTFIGMGVGIVVSETSLGMGAPLPEGLAKLVV